MKYRLLLVLMLAARLVVAEEAPKDEWNATNLSEETIKKIQQAQFGYKKCVVDEMHKPDYGKQESRRATDAIARLCEPKLGDMRKDYLDAGVPGVVADRHLKQLRIQVTRKMLQELMYIEAAKQAGQPEPK